jgi:hypothetical protein
MVFFLDYKTPVGSTRSLISQCDLVGPAIFLLASVALLLPVTWAGVLYSWDAWQTIVPLVAGAFGIICLGFHQTRISRHPAFRPGVFSNWAAIAGQIGAFVHGILLWLLIYYLVLYYEGVRGYSAVFTGIMVLPETLTLAPSAVVVGILITKTGSYRWANYLGWVLITTGFGLFYLLDANLSVIGLVFINIICGLGLGISLPGLSITIQAATRREDSGHTVAMMSVLRCAGQCLGVAIGTAIFTNGLGPKLRTAGASDDITVDGIMRAIESLHSIGDFEATHKIETALVETLRVIWIVGCALAAVTGLMFTSVKCPPLPERV